jgi:uncharacterized protein (DUF1778 family)
MSIGRVGPGRPSKGDRILRPCRIFGDVDTLIEADAAAQGLSLSDFLANLVHAHYALPPVAEPPTYLYQPGHSKVRQASRVRPARQRTGDRVLRAFRVSRDVNALIEADAAAQGLPMSDFLANLVHAHYGRPPVATPQTYMYQPEELALRQAS